MGSEATRITLSIASVSVMPSGYSIQTWVASGVLLNMVGLGMVLSFPSCLLPALASPGSDIVADLNTASWIASSYGLAYAPGTVASWLVMDCRGRRFTHMVFMVPLILGWLLIYFAHNVSTLMLARIFGGFATGCTVNLGAVVIGEYTSPQLRGVFLNLKSAAVCIGYIAMHILGHFFHWRTIAICGFVVHLITLLNVYTWPESPAWLASKEQFEASEKSFFFLRGNSQNSKREFEDLIKVQKKIKTTNETTSINKLKEVSKTFLRKDFRKPFLIMFFASVLLESSGRHFFPAYATQIIEEVVGGKSLYAVIGIDSLALLGALLSAALAGSVRRRVLLFSCASSALLVLSVFCIEQLLFNLHLISQSAFIPISLLIIYFILTNIGCSPILIALNGEIFPLAHRGSGPALLGVVMSLYMMMVLKIAPYLMATVKVYGMFAVFGAAMAGSAIVLYFILPETKDRTLQEIEDYFKSGCFVNEKVRKDEEPMIALMLQE